MKLMLEILLLVLLCTTVVQIHAETKPAKANTPATPTPADIAATKFKTFSDRFTKKREEHKAAVKTIKEQEAVDEQLALQILLDRLYVEIAKASGILNEVVFLKTGDVYTWNTRKINMGNLLLEQSFWSIIENTAYLSETLFQTPKTAQLLSKDLPARDIILRFSVELSQTSGLFNPLDPFLLSILRGLQESTKKLNLTDLEGKVRDIFNNIGYEEDVKQGRANGKLPQKSLTLLHNHPAYNKELSEAEKYLEKIKEVMEDNDIDLE